ncbi:hypothetical protein D7D25_04600 [Proteiniphilum sp. X52]|nr:hypothetical protein D7D25_04600 [Proteiniphilum sp. X52]
MKREIELFFLFIFHLFPLFLVVQQEIEVRGKVVEAETNEPLPGVGLLRILQESAYGYGRSF